MAFKERGFFVMLEVIKKSKYLDKFDKIIIICCYKLTRENVCIFFRSRVEIQMAQGKEDNQFGEKNLRMNSSQT